MHYKHVLQSRKCYWCADDFILFIYRECFPLRCCFSDVLKQNVSSLVACLQYGRRLWTFQLCFTRAVLIHRRQSLLTTGQPVAVWKGWVYGYPLKPDSGRRISGFSGSCHAESVNRRLFRAGLQALFALCRQAVQWIPEVNRRAKLRTRRRIKYAMSTYEYILWNRIGVWQNETGNHH